MAESHAELSQTDRPGIFAGSARWIAAAVLITGPLLQAIEFLLGNEAADNAARVAFWSAFPTRGGFSMASGMLAVPFLLGGIAVLVALTQTHSRRLAWLAGAFMTFAMVGFIILAVALVRGYHRSASLIAPSATQPG